MERLTEYRSDISRMACRDGVSTRSLIDRLAAYEDTGLEPVEIMDAKSGKLILHPIETAFGVPIERIRELAEAEQDGRLVVLPCNPGEYWRDYYGEKVLIKTVSFSKHLRLPCNTDMVTYSYVGDEEEFAVNWIYFKGHFTREEAEAALAEKDGAE